MDHHLTFLKIPPSRIVECKFIVESYEGLAVVRTIDPSKGILVLISTLDTQTIVEQLLDDILPALDARLIDQPQDLAGDWLLSGE